MEKKILRPQSQTTQHSRDFTAVKTTTEELTTKQATVYLNLRYTFSTKAEANRSNT